ncbi:LOW QUALITY PROTEIN: cation channel sperm-associated auxiliary subunit gamma-like [Montipora capricornis]|uniref:LOW QUALITY PROTEIN: cation channel sperm-associated auxiliary subunit gamma-like n=1 Tax=Montipora capricornis TaxID=246305 RepID=UPI0035F1F71C
MAKVASTIVPNGHYFLRMRIKCDDMINSEMQRSLVLTGVKPMVSIEIESEAFAANYDKDRRFSIVILSALVEMGDQHDCGCILRNKTSGNSWSSKCICSSVRPSCPQPQANYMLEERIKCCRIEKNCSIYLELCNPAWVAPLYISETAKALHCEVVDSGIGPYLNSHRYSVRIDGFHKSINNTLQSWLGKKVSELQLPVNQTMSVNCILNLDPVCIIASPELTEHIIYANSELEMMEFFKIHFETEDRKNCVFEQSLSTVEVKGALPSSDRIIMNTDVGLFEIQADFSKTATNTESEGYSLVLEACMRHVVSPAHPSAHSIIVLGFGEEQDQEKVFAASLVKGKPSEFHEQTDFDGLNACQFLKLQQHLTGLQSDFCQVISGSVSGVIPGYFVVLVKLSTAETHTSHLLQYEVLSNGGRWKLLFHFPTAITMSETDPDSWMQLDSNTSSQQDPQSSVLALSGLSSTAFVSDSLFLWGNNFLYSPDGGLSIHWLTSFPRNSTIVVFTSSPFDGTFAFLTNHQEVWVGQVGSATVQKLKSSVGPKKLSPGFHENRNAFTVSIFFDSGGGLQKIIIVGDLGGESKCISREELPVGKIMSQQIFAQAQEEGIKAYKKARTNATSCFIKEQFTRPFQLKDLPRRCPFARIDFEAIHDVLYTRNCFYKFEPSLRLGSGFIHKTVDLHEYFTKVYQTVNPECAGFSKDNRKAMRNYLPKLISLGRLYSYSFAFYLHLDQDFKDETRVHSWSLPHLQASFQVSDARVLNVTSNRKDLTARKAVKYEVTVRDSGLRLPQSYSGESLTPASLRIQVWKSGLSCSKSYGSAGFLEGSYVMNVLLGCPSGLKIVFDSEASKTATGKKHFCSAVHGVPCFYFYRDFLPVFRLLDLATGKISRFNGKYTLKIVGGGPSYQSITDYTEEEQIKYNYQTTSSMASLIWASKIKTLGNIPVFTSSTNGISWLCGTQSPCADVGPNFPGNAEYYFNLEFSNWVVGADTSNCHFTIRFLIRVHGLPPGSLNPSSVIVLACIGILSTIILSAFVLKRQNANLWVQLKSVFAEGMYHRCRARIYNSPENKTDSLPTEIELETVNPGFGGICSGRWYLAISVLLDATTGEDSKNNDNVSVYMKGTNSELSEVFQANV